MNKKVMLILLLSCHLLLASASNCNLFLSATEIAETLREALIFDHELFLRAKLLQEQLVLNPYVDQGSYQLAQVIFPDVGEAQRADIANTITVILQNDMLQFLDDMPSLPAAPTAEAVELAFLRKLQTNIIFRRALRRLQKLSGPKRLSAAQELYVKLDLPDRLQPMIEHCKAMSGKHELLLYLRSERERSRLRGAQILLELNRATVFDRPS